MQLRHLVDQELGFAQSLRISWGGLYQSVEVIGTEKRVGSQHLLSSVEGVCAGAITASKG